MAKNSSEKDLSFEASLEALEALIEKLEDPKTPLDSVVATFTEGQKLLKVCQARLEAAELKLEEAGKDGKTKEL